MVMWTTPVGLLDGVLDEPALELPQPASTSPADASAARTRRRVSMPAVTRFIACPLVGIFTTATPPTESGTSAGRGRGPCARPAPLRPGGYERARPWGRALPARRSRRSPRLVR